MPNELRQARAERYDTIKPKIEDLDKTCAETRKVIDDLRRLLSSVPVCNGGWSTLKRSRRDPSGILMVAFRKPADQEMRV